MQTTIDRLLKVTQKFIDTRGHPDADVTLTSASAICQDAFIFGIDVDDYVAELETEFGAIFWEIPWGRFTDQTASFRGIGCLLVLPWLIWRIIQHPFTGGALVPRPNPRTFHARLELGHVAEVIDRGGWIEP